MNKFLKNDFLKLIIIISILFYISVGNNLFGNKYKIKTSDISNIINKKNIDIAKLAVTISKIAFSEIDIEKSLKEINNMSEVIKMNIDENNDPYYKIGVINDYLFKETSFSYDMEDMGAQKDINQFITGYLDTKKGSCITMPLLYYIIGVKVGLPIFWVRAPEHFFCRYMLKDRTYINIEATSGGKVAPDQSYINDFNISENEIKKGVYMKSLSSKECSADLLCILALYYARKNDFNSAIDYLKMSLKLYPNNALAYKSLSLIYNDMGNNKESNNSLEKAILFGYEEKGKL